MRTDIYLQWSASLTFLSGDSMEQCIDRSCVPRNVLDAIDVIYEYLPKSLLTEIRISKQDGSFCTPTSGTSPSPPPYDVRVQWSARIRIKKGKIIYKSPEEVGKALQAAMRARVLPETGEEPKTYQELYINASNSSKGNATYTWHLLGRKLRGDEDLTKPLRIREQNVAKLFRDLFPHVHAKSLEYDLSKARRIFDVTCKLSCRQVLCIKNISAEDIRRITKKNLSKVLKYCK